DGIVPGRHGPMFAGVDERIGEDLARPLGLALQCPAAEKLASVRGWRGTAHTLQYDRKAPSAPRVAGLPGTRLALWSLRYGRPRSALTGSASSPALVMTPKEVLALCRQEEIRAVDLRFMDFPGTQKHFTIPVTALTEKSFEDGFGFDASSM